MDRNLNSAGLTPSAERTIFDTRLLHDQQHRSHSYATSANANTNQASSSSAEHHSRLSTSSASPPRPRPSYHSHPGCVLCSVVASASTSAAAASPTSRPNSPSPQPSPTTTSAFLPPVSASPYPQPFSSGEALSPLSQTGTSSSTSRDMTRVASVDGREVMFQDDEITVYRASGKERLCSGGRHVVAVINKHVESVYDFGPADVPLLNHLIETTNRLLHTPSSSPPSEVSSATASEAERGKGKAKSDDFRVGFVGSVTKDPQSPHAHLHAHALLGPIDHLLPGATFWRRNVVFGSVNWWSIEDLIAEIRESTSNNRIKSGYQDRARAPITRVPEAGSVAGLPNALDPAEFKDAPSPALSANSESTFPHATASNMDAVPSVSLSPPKASTSASQSISRQDSDDSGDGYVAVELDDAR